MLACPPCGCCFLWVLQCAWGGETVCQSISRSISLLRERGVCAALRQQQCAHASPKSRENRPTPADEVRNRERPASSPRRSPKAAGGHLTYRGQRAVEQRQLQRLPHCPGPTHQGQKAKRPKRECAPTQRRRTAYRQT